MQSMQHIRINSLYNIVTIATKCASSLCYILFSAGGLFFCPEKFSILGQSNY